MRPSLPLRLFLVHLVFTVGAGVIAVYLVARSFESYAEGWRARVRTAFPAEMYRPFANEVARSLLLGQDADYPEVRERRRETIASGLGAVLREIPSIRSIVVVDDDLRIQYASDPAVTDLAFRHPEDADFLCSETVKRRPRDLGRGEIVEEMVIPVFDDRGTPEGQAPRRVGAILTRFVPDAALLARSVEGDVPSVSWGMFALPLLLFVAAACAGGIAIAAVTGLPVRRLDRALAELRARGFRGGLDVRGLGLDDRLASAVQTINELGGRLEALDARGREREELLAKLSQSLEEGMVALGPTGEVVAWNDAAVRILGAPPAEAGGGIAEALARNPGLVAHSGEREPREVEVERAGGGRIAAKVTRIPLELRPGEAGSLVLLRDLGTLKSIETHLLEAGRFAVLAHLAAGLAHEIRNPLHSIGLNATVVEEYVGAARTPERLVAMNESLATINAETQRLADLLNSYLGLVRPGRGTGPVDVGDLCRRVTSLLAYAARKSNVEIRIVVGSEVPLVHGAADRLQQAVLNLVLNAIQAMPGGGVVSIRAEGTGGQVRLTVSDTGPGVPGDLAAHLFDARVTTKPGGTGLGLPLVRMIAEAHGGSVSYGSAPGQGASFTLVLPVRQVA